MASTRDADDGGLGDARLPAEVARHRGARHGPGSPAFLRRVLRRGPGAVVRRAGRLRRSCMQRLGIGGTICTLPAGVGAAGARRAVASRSGRSIVIAARHRIGAARLAVPQRLRAAVRADGPQRAPARQDDPRRHLRPRRRGAGRRHRAAAAAHGLASFSGELLAVVLVLAGSPRSGSDAGSIRCTSASSKQQLVKHRDAPAGERRLRSGMDGVCSFPTAAAVEPQQRPRRRAPASAAGLRLQLDDAAGAAGRPAVGRSRPGRRRRWRRPHDVSIAFTSRRSSTCWRGTRCWRRAQGPRAVATIARRHADGCAARAADGFRHPPPPAANAGHASLRRAASTAWCSGLDDPRFEVRYHCSRAIDRMLAQEPEPAVDRARMIAVIERELSVPPQVWQGYRLLDRPERG